MFPKVKELLNLAARYQGSKNITDLEKEQFKQLNSAELMELAELSCESSTQDYINKFIARLNKAEFSEAELVSAQKFIIRSQLLFCFKQNFDQQCEVEREIERRIQVLIDERLLLNNEISNLTAENNSLRREKEYFATLTDAWQREHQQSLIYIAALESHIMNLQQLIARNSSGAMAAGNAPETALRSQLPEPSFHISQGSGAIHSALWSSRAILPPAQPEKSSITSTQARI